MPNPSGADAPLVLSNIGEIVEDAAEETFVLFSHDFPQNDLGILDPKAPCIEIEVAGHDYTVQQSSGLLNSSREAGTTGAMLWKVTPFMAGWLASKESSLWSKGILTASSNVVELGCGIAGLIGLAVSPLVSSYVLTDQEYVMKVLKKNLVANSSQRDSNKKAQRLFLKKDNIFVLPLDWENDSAHNIRQVIPACEDIDLVVLCDCIYNTYLIKPLLNTCVDICRLSTARRTTLLIAQQLRTDEVFEQWMSALLQFFIVYRVSDAQLPVSIRTGSGYAVHLAVLRNSPTL